MHSQMLDDEFLGRSDILQVIVRKAHAHSIARLRGLAGADRIGGNNEVDG